MRFPLLSKALAVAVVLLMLMAGLGAVSGLVAEREGRLREAERSVADSLASRQTVVGPVLHSRCTERWVVEQGEGRDRKSVTEQREFTLSAVPQLLQVEASAAAEARYRGIFKVNGYTLKARLQAAWTAPPALKPVAQHPGSTLACEAPVLFVAVGDARGIRLARVSVDGAALAVAPGTRHAAHPRGFHVELPPGRVEAGPMRAEVTLELAGTGDIAWVPAAEHTELALKSDWPHPSFEGRFLPTEREVGDQGFSARWQVSALASSAPQDLLAGAAVCGELQGEAAAAAPMSARGRCVETFGVSFIDPVGAYRLSDRATKYGLLFIALTFIGVGLVEVLQRLRVHPIQYGLVGAALVVFFLLLASLTEHLPFGWAYAIAAAACTVLLSFYGSFVLHGWRPGLWFGAGVGALYATLYLLLQMEQSALVLGSVLLFGVLSVVMVATRHIDWYALFGVLRTDGKGLPAPHG